MTNKENNYILTTYGFRRVPLSANLRQERQINIKDPQQHKNTVERNQYKRNEILVSQYPTSYLDRKWLHNLRRINLIDRPKSVPPFSSTNSVYSEIIPMDNRSCGNKLLKRRVKSAEPIIKCPIACDTLNHEDLTIGQKKYLWDIARCYSVQQLKELTKQRMKCLLDYEFMKRYITSGVPDKVKVNLWKEYCDYRIQIDKSARKRCSPYSPTHSQSRRQSSKCSSPVITDENKCDDVTKVLVTEELDGKPIVIEDKELHLGEEVTSVGVNGQVEGEVTVRRVRPKSAKYQKRGINAINSQTRTLSPGSSQEDELVFAAEEKLSLFEKVLMDNIPDSCTKS